MTLIADLTNKKLATPSDFIVTNTVYETLMGSTAYGCSLGNSDKDIYGFCIPPLDMIFPHLRGEIVGFGNQLQRFEVYQEHHMKDGDVTHDVSIYSIVKYFHLLMDNNPNMADSLWTYDDDVITQTKISKMVRDNRKMFLHRGAYHRYIGYAHAQMHKIKNKHGHMNPKRNETIQQYGYDTKYAMHCLRLMREVEQILLTGDFDIKNDKDFLIEVRKGKYTLTQLEQEFLRQEIVITQAYNNSKLQDIPNENAIKELLLNCIEEFHGKLEFFKL
jgi:predicted nucleotidyltransferase